MPLLEVGALVQEHGRQSFRVLPVHELGWQHDRAAVRPAAERAGDAARDHNAFLRTARAGERADPVRSAGGAAQRAPQNDPTEDGVQDEEECADQEQAREEDAVGSECAGARCALRRARGENGRMRGRTRGRAIECGRRLLPRRRCLHRDERPRVRPESLTAVGIEARPRGPSCGLPPRGIVCLRDRDPRGRSRREAPRRR